MDQALLIVRVVFGLLMAGHGAQKLFGWFGGYGIAGTGGFLETMGFKPGRLFAAAAGLSELASGVLIALGLFGPVGPAILLTVMIVATVSAHWGHGVFAATNGVELPLLYATAAIGLALSGHGRLSLDAALGLASFWTPAAITAVLLSGIAAGIINLSARRMPVTAE